mgnify:CR=1 FL=1
MPPPTFPAPTLPVGTAAAITAGETMLLLIPAPGDESWSCGALIAETCRRGRPPFVMVLGDGSAGAADEAAAEKLARRREREIRAALPALGLPPGRLLMAGLHDGRIPASGPAFAAVVRAVALVSWARDCNLICAPWPWPPDQAACRTHAVAEAVAAETGIAHRCYLARPGAGGAAPVPAMAAGWHFPPGPHAAARAAALAAYAGEEGAPGFGPAPAAEIYLARRVAEGYSPNRSA